MNINYIYIIESSGNTGTSSSLIFNMRAGCILFVRIHAPHLAY